MVWYSLNPVLADLDGASYSFAFDREQVWSIDVFSQFDVLIGDVTVAEVSDDGGPELLRVGWGT